MSGGPSGTADLAIYRNDSGALELSARPEPDRPRREMPLSRWVILVFAVALIVLIANAPGRIFFDTKLGVDIDPAGFYQRLWHLWDPNEWFGTLQDQYIGYAVPMAPFYLLGALLKVPVWFTERLWLASLLTAGFAGLVKLADALGIGTRRSRLVAGLAFVLWPTFIIVLGSTSAGILPGLLVPWAVLPLVRAVAGGSCARAAARSGLAIVCMGGVNATSTLDVLILPALFILVALRGRRRIAMAGYWLAAVIVATSWWAVPLLLQARYSFNFLPYIEQAATTSATMSAAAFLRGASNWAAYLNLGQPWLQAGWVMVANPIAIIAAAVASATGLLGVARRDIPHGLWLRLSLGLAALVALSGYPGPLGGVFHQGVDNLLNGAGAPLRSMFKFEPVVAVILGLGIAHALVLRTRRPAISADPAPRTLWHLLAAPAIVLVLLGLGYPMISGQVLNAGSFTAVPGYWYRVAAYLRAHSPDSPALVVPAESHGTFLWGETVDDPLEPLASSPWVTQGLVPYGGAGSQLLLTSLEDAVTSGEAVSGLTATLDRSGIKYVVVRNDLNPTEPDYTSPELVHQALLRSGFHRIASFGPPVTGAQTDPGAPQIQYALPSYPAVEVFAANSGPASAPPPVAALPVSKTVLVNGGPDALLQLAGQHLLAPSAPAVLAGDKLVTRPAQWAVTDSLRRADRTFGLISSGASYTYTANETNPPDDPLGDAGGPPRQLLPVTGPGHQTVAVLRGAASVTASSSGSWLTEMPQIDPVNAFDGNPHTVWTEASPTSAVGQWIQITFSRPVVLPDSIGLALLDDVPARPVADRLTIRTDRGVLTSKVLRTAREQPLGVPPGPTRRLRITIAAVSGQKGAGLGAGIADIAIPGVRVTRYLKVPQSAAGLAASSVAFSFSQQLPSPATLANVAAYPPMARTFATPGLASYRFSGTAIAVPGPDLDAVLGEISPAGPGNLQVTASSTWGGLPALAPTNLFSTRHPGAWIAGAQKPVIRLSWRGARTIKQMVIQPVAGFAAAPEAIKIVSPDGTRFASVGLDGLTEIVPPLTTDRMTISFPVVQYATAVQPVSGQVSQLPVGLSKLSIPALRGLTTAAPDAAARFSLPCGRGPAISIDGHARQTSVSGTVGELINFLPVQVRICEPGSLLTLGAGRHWLSAASPGAFAVTGLSLTSVAPQAAGSGQHTQLAATPPSSGRGVRVLTWESEYRRVRVGPGTAVYLEVHQNANPGWVATLGGHALTPVQLDGWQQGYVIPAGEGGVVTLTFAPARFYDDWLILSALGVLALFGVAVLRRGSRPGAGPLRALTAGTWPRALAAAPQDGSGPTEPDPAVPADAGHISDDDLARAYNLVGIGPAGATRADEPTSAEMPAADAEPTADAKSAADPESAVDHESAASRTGPIRAWAWTAVAGLAVCAVIAVVGGPAAVGVPVLAVIAYRRPGWRGPLAFAAMIVAGLVTALAAHPEAPGTGAFSGLAQACALGALTMALLPPAGRPRAPAGSSPETESS
jgi:arabinofuranan 3-O-arabinosyltransferase